MAEFFLAGHHKKHKLDAEILVVPRNHWMAWNRKISLPMNEPKNTHRTDRPWKVDFSWKSHPSENGSCSRKTSQMILIQTSEPPNFRPNAPKPRAGHEKKPMLWPTCFGRFHRHSFPKLHMAEARFSTQKNSSFPWKLGLGGAIPRNYPKTQDSKSPPGLFDCFSREIPTNQPSFVTSQHPRWGATEVPKFDLASGVVDYDAENVTKVPTEWVITNDFALQVQDH